MLLIQTKNVPSATSMTGQQGCLHLRQWSESPILYSSCGTRQKQWDRLPSKHWGPPSCLVTWQQHSDGHWMQSSQIQSMAIQRLESIKTSSGQYDRNSCSWKGNKAHFFKPANNPMGSGQAKKESQQGTFLICHFMREKWHISRTLYDYKRTTANKLRCVFSKTVQKI